MRLEDCAEVSDLGTSEGIPVGRGREYFYDTESRKQVEHAPFFGLAWHGYARGANGAYVKDTCKGVEVVDLSTRRRVLIKPRAGFKLALKSWHPENPRGEWKRFQADAEVR